MSISVAKRKIKKNSIPIDIKPKHIFNAVSQEMGHICPQYSTIRSQIIRNINKQFPPKIKSFDDIPIESEYYKTKRNRNFMIFKNTDLIIFQYHSKRIYFRIIIKIYLRTVHIMQHRNLVISYL